MWGRLTPRTVLLSAALITVVAAPAAIATTNHQEYVAQVNPICKDATRQAKKIRRIKKTGQPLVDALRKTGLYAKLLGKTIRRIAAVSPAPGEEAQVKAWLDSDRRTLRLIRGFLRSASHGDFNRARVLIPKIVRSQRINRRKAAALGLPACSKAARQQPA